MAEGKQGRDNRQRHEQRGEGPPPAPNPVAPLGALHCPLCGSRCIRSRNRPLFLNVGACLILGPFLVLAFLFESCLFGFLWLLVQALLVFALSVTVCIALVGYHRCRDCGHRFGPRYRTDGRVADTRFPLRFTVLGTLLFGAAVMTGLVLIVTVPHRPEWVVALGVLARVVLAAFAAGVCVVFQAILWRLLRTRVKHRRTLAVLLLLPSVVLSGLWITSACLDRKVVLRHVRPEARAARILHNGQLAALPDSATDIEVHTWSSPFSGEEFLRFAAEPNDIERFVRESRSLQGKVPTLYSAEHMRVPVRDNMQKRWELEQAGHEVYFPHATTPDWYKQEITGPARRYIFRPKRYQFDAEVIVDDEQNVVYIYLCFS